MGKFFRYLLSILILISVFLVIVLKVPSGTVMAFEESGKTLDYFVGEGTEESPYLIGSALDLCKLSELVNDGNEFRNTYFEQTKDLDFGFLDNFIPIGIFHSDRYFYGTYDGAGYKLYNLRIVSEKSESKNVALFGQLGGTVKNLGIESGLIQGDYIGSIASHAVGKQAKIINCYNKARVEASERAGGIADNFGQGLIINCWNEGEIEGKITGGIVSYTAGVIYNSYCIQENGTNENYQGIVLHSESIQNKKTQSSSLVQEMNEGMKEAESFFELQIGSLRQWEDIKGEIILRDKGAHNDI